MVYDMDVQTCSSMSVNAIGNQELDWKRVNQMCSITRNKLGLGQGLKGVASSRPRDEVDLLRNPALLK